ncbi:phospho-N-acetylmuramoyl-pentapeptide-transferase [Seleniivibrio woodruffii]|uniref:Phospho-N-acetylmuramoyl-pentapeptide-transferase n=1 Tax=Seleniivibrio woodruffii TaxID=1078050 RepID=A0A4R1K2G5_9BACT|nr:phospho-N-acetylmuramoyl-pentapeptide-transferase [Seleniivibrio woodruffii]TCK58218.1 phospho-N-acetylmuramoyl-pentapeptide-transferase [Seleniivibrio woodruffii]TVZ35683.1 phospho-N-acetylmuramoyl-pentapeptide-transferase [Seleniivibrio woodruffii]
MLYNILVPLSEYLSFLNVFRYITFRTAYAAITALVITLVFGPYVIRKLKEMSFSMKSKGYEPERHKVKEGTPTMGGVMIVGSAAISTLLWADLRNPYIWIVLLLFMGYGLIGFVDDYKKTILKNPNGISPRQKSGGQLFFAVIATFLVLYVDKTGVSTKLAMPFFKNLVINMGYLYCLFAVFIMIGTSNAVNLTDGLDGLAITPSIIAFVTIGFMTYLTGNYKFANYLNIIFVPGAGEVAIFCGAMVGAGLGFLWFNAHPASVFMGDVGSLSIGGALAGVAIIAKHEIALAIVGGIFVMETFSVILQVGYFKMTKGKRLFRMAPIHHHFELAGWSETKITVRFWIISFILALIALSTLKLR